MILSPSQEIWTLSASRFGAWWRRAKEWRQSLAVWMANDLRADTSTGHLTYKSSGGHLVYGCPTVICAGCPGGTIASSLTATLSGIVDSSCCAAFTNITTGSLDGTLTVPNVGGCNFRADVGTVTLTVYSGVGTPCTTVTSTSTLTAEIRIEYTNIGGTNYWVCSVIRKGFTGGIYWFVGRTTTWDCVSPITFTQFFSFCTGSGFGTYGSQSEGATGATVTVTP